MWNDQGLIWLGVAAAAALLLALWKLRKNSAQAASADEGEKPPVPVEHTTAYAGMHKGVKYWIYYENEKARIEIELGEEAAAPFMSDRRTGKAELPGDPRDLEVTELLELRAFYVEAGVTGLLVAALFPERVLNRHAGLPGGPTPVEAAANRIVELLAAIRDKSRRIKS